MTLTVDIRKPDGGAELAVELPAAVFDTQANLALMHQVVVAQLAAARSGTHAAKNRGDVRGGGTKPYRQKGTGRARQGSIRAPQFTGGGVVHPPVPRSYVQRTPKKMKAAALRGALSDRARGGRVHVVSGLVDGAAPSTKAAVEALADLASTRHLLVVAGREDLLTWKSLRNVTSVHLLDPGQLNTYDVLVSDDIVFTQAALESFLGEPLSTTTVDRPAPAKKASAKKTPAKKTAAKKAPAKKAPAKKAPAKKVEPVDTDAAADTDAAEIDDAADAEIDDAADADIDAADADETDDPEGKK